MAAVVRDRRNIPLMDFALVNHQLIHSYGRKRMTQEKINASSKRKVNV